MRYEVISHLTLDGDEYPVGSIINVQPAVAETFAHAVRAVVEVPPAAAEQTEAEATEEANAADADKPQGKKGKGK